MFFFSNHYDFLQEGILRGGLNTEFVFYQSIFPRKIDGTSPTRF